MGQTNYTFLPLVVSFPYGPKRTFGALESTESIFLVQLQCSNLNSISRIFPKIKDSVHNNQ